jgi:Fe2+ or Zn2+ uptake regulation protein
MTPLEVLRRYQNNVSLIDDCVLQMVSMAGECATVQQIVITCAVEKIASPATVHKSLNNLVEYGWIKSVRNPKDTDNRKHWITCTAAGQRRIKEFS